MGHRCQEFSHMGIYFVLLSESIDTSTPMGKMISALSLGEKVGIWNGCSLPDSPSGVLLVRRTIA
jgi:hypothetical protein